MDAVVARQISSLFRDFDTAFPNRDHTTDGTYPDPDHMTRVSGHNPDDTIGVQAEYSDVDTKPEVRAGDVDVNLRAADGTTDVVKMQQVLDRIIATPADVARLKYIIFNHRIASRNTGWAWKPYDGTDPHTNHAHLSGDPLHDENDAPYTSILSFGGDMSPREQYIQHVINYRIDAIIHMRPSCVVPAFTASDSSRFPGFTENNDLAAAIRALALQGGMTPEDIEKLASEIASDVTAGLDVPTSAENAEATVSALTKELTD